MNASDEIDRALSDEPVIEPTSGFAARVMRDVLLEAEQRTEPLDFPWHRFLPGFLSAITLSLAVFLLLGWAAEAGVSLPTPEAVLGALAQPLTQGLAIAAVTLAGSVAAIWLVLRSGRGRGLGI